MFREGESYLKDRVALPRLAVDLLDLAPGRGLRRRRAVDVHRDRDHFAPSAKLLVRRRGTAGPVEENRVVSRLRDQRVERGRLAHAVAVRNREGQGAPAGEHAGGVAVHDRSHRNVVNELDGRQK